MDSNSTLPPSTGIESSAKTLSLLQTLRLGVLVFTAFILFSGPIIPWHQPYFATSWGWADYGAKLRNPLLDLSKHRITPDEYNHLPTINYRLTGPVLAYLLHLNESGFAILSGIACFITGCAFVRLGWRFTGDRASALMTGLLFAGLTAASQSVRSFTGHFDGLAFCLLALALASTRWWLVAVATFFACWTDQRAVAVSAIVALTHSLRMNDGPGSRWFDIRQPACLAVVGGVFAWVLTFALTLKFSGMVFYRVERFNMSTVMTSISFAPQVAWGALEGGWLIFGGALIVAWRAGQRLLPFAMVSICGLYLALVFATLDVSRSASYLIPALALAVGVFSRNRSIPLVRQWLYAAAAASLLAPNYDIIVLVYTRTIQPLWFEALAILSSLWIAPAVS